jgi:O-antigen/teichoic acid export membrane protein
MIIFCGILLFGGITKSEFQIEWFVYIQTTSYIITALTALFIVIRKAEFNKLNWNWPFFVMIIKQSFPFAVLVFLMTCYNRIDSVMLERILPDGEEHAGIYARAFRLLDAANMIAYLFAILLLPIFAKMIKLKESVGQLVKLSYTILMIGAIIVASGSYFYNFELMDFLYNDNIEEASSVFRLIMISFIAISTTYIFGTLLTAIGNLKALNIIAGCSMIINITLNFILIPRFELIGAASASLTTQFLSAIVQVIVVCYVFKFKINYVYLLKLALFIVGVIATNIVFKEYINNWMISMGAMILLSFIIAASLRLLTVKSLISIIKEK